MDSKQLVNDIVYNRLSKARETIIEEMTNRVSSSISQSNLHEALSFTTGVKAAVGAGAAAYGLYKGAKALKQKFGAVGKSKKKQEKEAGKKETAEAKYDLMWRKSSQKKKVDGLEDDKIRPGRGVKLSDKEEKDNKGIQDKIDGLRDEFDDEFKTKYAKLSKKTGVGKGASGGAAAGKKARAAEREKEKDKEDIDDNKDKGKKTTDEPDSVEQKKQEKKENQVKKFDRRMEDENEAYEKQKATDEEEHNKAISSVDKAFGLAAVEGDNKSGEALLKQVDKLGAEYKQKREVADGARKESTRKNLDKRNRWAKLAGIEEVGEPTSDEEEEEEEE